MNRGNLKKALLGSVPAFLFSVGDGFAQDAADGESASQKESDEIVVTAQRREENLQDVAAAAVVIDSDGLKDKAVQRLDDLQYASPSLSITDAGLTQNVNIRGIGLASGSPAVTNGVATYIDGLFQPPIVTTNGFYDLGSVEVFRGPQGTFVGANSTGGAIFINSRNPDFESVNGYGEFSIGNYESRGFEGAINLPIAEILAVRAAGFARRRDSYYTDVGPFANNPDSLEEGAGRIGVLFKPAESFQALSKVEIGKKDSGGYAYHPIPGSPYAPFDTGEIRTLRYDAQTNNIEKYIQASNELRYETAGGTTFRLVSGYQNKRIDNQYDFDGTDGPPPSTQDQFVRERIWTEELNVISPDDGPITWIVGAYFQQNKIDVDITQATAGFPTDIDIFTKKETIGGFGHATYQMLPTVQVEAGVRYNAFNSSGSGAVVIGMGIPGFPPGGLTVADLSSAHKDHGISGKVGVNWTPDDNNLIYAFVARGYKPGGAASAVLEFEPEFVIDYEVGWKSTLADGNVRTQLSAFYYDYTNFQFDTVDTGTGQVNPINLTDATIYGVEGQLQAVFGDLTIDAGAAYVHSELGNATVVDQRALGRDFPGVNLVPQCPAGVPTTPGFCIDYDPYLIDIGGGPNLYSPKWTFNIGVEYAFHAGDVTITPRFNYAYVGEQFSYIGYSPVSDLLESRRLLSALLTIDFGRYSVQAYGRNLADKEYVSGQFVNTQFYGPPREYGVRLRATF